MNNSPPGPFSGSYDQPWSSYNGQRDQTGYGNAMNPDMHSPGQQWQYEPDDFYRQSSRHYNHAQQPAFGPVNHRRWSGGQYMPRALAQDSVGSQPPNPWLPHQSHVHHFTPGSGATPSHGAHQDYDLPHGMYRPNLQSPQALQGIQTQIPLHSYNIPNVNASVSTGSAPNPPPIHPTVVQPRRTREGDNTIQVYTSGPLIQEPYKDQKPLNADYKRITKSKKFFVVGKVFLTLWSEPAGGNADDDNKNSGITSAFSGFSIGTFGETVFSEIRRFVVVREGDKHCEALSVCTYGRKGVSKNGVNKSEHAIIYTGKQAPPPLAGELPARGEEGLLPQAIRVDPDSPEQKLDPISRVDFAKVYTIQHNVKVRSFGRVNRDSMQTLLFQFRLVWSKYFDAGTKLQVQARPRPGAKATDDTESSSRSKILAAYNALLACDLGREKALAALSSAGVDLSSQNLEDHDLCEDSNGRIVDNGDDDDNELNEAP